MKSSHAKTTKTTKTNGTQKKTASRTPHVPTPATPTPQRRNNRWLEAERAILGAPNDFYLIGKEHSLGDMVKACLAPDASCGDDVLYQGIRNVAEEFHTFASWLTDGDGKQSNDESIARVARNIEGRLRVLAELARRTRVAVDADEPAVHS